MNMKVLRSGPVSWVLELEQALGGSGCFLDDIVA